MKIKIIKKTLSVLLTISSLATFTFFTSADDGNRHDLQSKIAECDQIIDECNETILNFEKEKDRNIESINSNLQALDAIKKILDGGEILECNLQDLENQNKDLLQKIEHIEENYQNNIKVACEIKQQQFNKKAEFQKKLDELAKKEKNLRENVRDLINKSVILKAKFNSQPELNKKKLDINSKFALTNFQRRCQTLYQNNQLNTEEFNRLQKEFNDLKVKVDAICQSKNFQAGSSAPGQSQENANLWQKINSGAQCYKANHVADNLCWLHCATNIRNYYNNMKNKGIIKGQNAVVQEYRKIMGDQAAKDNINGSMKEFVQISEYLQKCGLGSFQVIISSSSNNSKQKIKSTAKELLKAHFKKIKKTSPVIGHVGGSRGHFITIAGFDENQDKFLVVDSSEDQSIEARVTWRKSEDFLQALTKQGFSGEHTIELDFTSEVNELRSVGLTVNENDSIIQKDLMIANDEEIQTSIDVLKDVIENY